MNKIRQYVCLFQRLRILPSTQKVQGSELWEILSYCAQFGTEICNLYFILYFILKPVQQWWPGQGLAIKQFFQAPGRRSINVTDDFSVVKTFTLLNFEQLKFATAVCWIQLRGIQSITEHFHMSIRLRFRRDRFILTVIYESTKVFYKC